MRWEVAGTLGKSGHNATRSSGSGLADSMLIMRRWASTYPLMSRSGQDCKHRPGVYVPQLGDDVVYIWEGHQQYLETTNDKARGPWTTVTSTDVSSNCLLTQARLFHPSPDP